MTPTAVQTCKVNGIDGVNATQGVLVFSQVQANSAQASQKKPKLASTYKLIFPSGKLPKHGAVLEQSRILHGAVTFMDQSVKSHDSPSADLSVGVIQEERRGTLEGVPVLK